METPNYIKSLLLPSGKRPAGRKVWSIDLETVWLPFFTATNVMGDSHIAPEALGAPIRLGYNADGSVKFSQSGRPVTKVVKDLSDSIRLVRENFTAGLVSYANTVVTEREADYKAEVDRQHKAGKPIALKDKASLERAIRLRAEAELETAAAATPVATAAPPATADKPEMPATKGKVPVHA